MSIHSSPASVVSHPRSPVSETLTPTRKVQALLAQFDDSDSDGANTGKTGNDARASEHRGEEVGRVESTEMGIASESESEDGVLIPSRSRIASRLQGLSNPSGSNDGANSERASTVRQKISSQRASQEQPSDSSTDDKLAEPITKRRLLTKKRSVSPIISGGRLENKSRSASPLFFPSPRDRERRASDVSEQGSDSEELPEDPLAGSKSKFLALVEKHRKQRLEKEAAEAAKKAARTETLKLQAAQSRTQRGSSPADGTDEDSDMANNVSDGAHTLSKQARPTRKASKKALEEMSRETQRMSRNMQLAHQARTKKKITKQSLLARFNFPIPASTSVASPGEVMKSATASSEVGSDTEASKGHDTPPTSPMQEPCSADDASKSITTVEQTNVLLVQSTQGREPPHAEDPMTKPFSRRDKGKGRAVSEGPVAEDAMSRFDGLKNRASQSGFYQERPSAKGGIQPVSMKWTKQNVEAGQADDSGSDLEIITSKGDRRKYAVFEHLPKRRAQETQSHFVLRSLAHLGGGDDQKRSSMNAVEMDAALRRAARMQARQEREQKIAELKARGVVIQTAEERERDQQEVEDLVERARQEAAEIQRREKELAKKEGTFVKDDLDDDESDEEEEDDDEDNVMSGSEDESGSQTDDGDDGEDNAPENAQDRSRLAHDEDNLLDTEADERSLDDETDGSDPHDETTESSGDEKQEPGIQEPDPILRKPRVTRVLSDDEESNPQSHEVYSPRLPPPAKTPQSHPRSARKQIPGLRMSDDLPLGLTQAFAATLADSQSQSMRQTQEDSLTMLRDLPSPNIPIAPQLNRLDSVEFVSDSQPASQTQPLNIQLSLSPPQVVPQSPVVGRGWASLELTPSQPQFDPTQDAGYMLSPFTGNRFATQTPQPAAPHSTVDTVILPTDSPDSPMVQRKGRLRRGGVDMVPSDQDGLGVTKTSAFEVMRRAAKKKGDVLFDKATSIAREAIDEAAEESEDEYAGLGGASDEDANEEENEEDRRMIDENTQVGKGEEAKLAGLFADRERREDEAAVSKLLKDITTGALRRKRGTNDDLDLSDEEDAAARRREAKRREFAKMRRELLKDEAVGKIAEDKKKEAFLQSIEDRDADDDDGVDEDFNGQSETQGDDESQNPSSAVESRVGATDLPRDKRPSTGLSSKRPFESAAPSRLNSQAAPSRRTTASLTRKPTTLAEIRESVSFLIEEPESQAGTVDLGLSDSEDEPEAYVDLDRHLKTAEADENADDDDVDDLGGFIVDDDGPAAGDGGQAAFKRPDRPSREAREPFSESRPKERSHVVNRLSLLRQQSSSLSSSSSSSSSTTKMAFHTSTSTTNVGLSKVPSLLRRATTNSSFGSIASRDENVSATGVVTSRTERGSVNEEKEYVRKGSGGRRNAVNYRPTVKEEKMSQRAGVAKKTASRRKGTGGFLGGLFSGESWG